MSGEQADIEEVIRRNVAPQRVPSASVLGIRFSILSTEEIIRQSVVEVSSLSMEPSEPGLHAAQLGTVSKYQECGTCGSYVDRCPMHFGHIRLPSPLIYPKARSKVAKLLNCFCQQCLKDNGSFTLYYDDDEIAKFANISPEKRLNAITDAGKRNCQYGTCQSYTAPKSRIDIVSKAGAKAIPILDLITMLNKMDREDLVKLGVMVYPASLYVFDTIPVPPIQIRPPDSLTGKPHQLTLALKNILSAIQSTVNTNTKMSDIFKAYVIYTSQTEEVKLSESNDTVIGLKSVLDGKEGHIRGNVNGKRTNYCGRSVVSPDPSLEIDQIGVPAEMAANLTTEETIYRLNIGLYTSVLEAQKRANQTQYIRELFTRYKEYQTIVSDWELILRTQPQRRSEAERELRNLRRENRSLQVEYQLFFQTRGTIKYVTRGHRNIMLTPSVLQDFKLRMGDVIHRTLIDGDPVTINRQPSLHKFSIVAGLVSIKPYRTIGVHLSFAPGLGMDMDGDEATLNVPQSYLAKAEVISLMTIRECTVSEKNGTIINGLIQDGVLGLYLLSQDRTVLTRDQWENAVAASNREWRVPMVRRRAAELNINQYSGKALISVLFPEDFNYRKVYDANRVVEVVNGILTTGILTKGTISEDDGSILQMLNKFYGARVATDFQGGAFPLVTSWLTESGFSFNYSDCDPGREVETKIRALTENVRKDVIETYRHGTTSTEDKLENIVNTKISSTKAKVDKLLLENANVQVVNLDRSGSQRVVGAYCMYTAKGRFVLPADVITSITLNYNIRRAFYTTNNGEEVAIPTIGLISVTVAYHDGKDVQFLTRYWYAQNSFLAMVDSKSKGTFNNYSQVAGIVSQQSLSGRRIQRTLANNSVTLPHFEQRVRDPVSEGFINYGYLHGIPPLQYYIHGIAARQAFIETTVSTPETGYFTRKLTKLLENNVAQFDNTVRSTSYAMVKPDGTEVVVGSRVESEMTGNQRPVGGPIVQFVYGQYGFAPNKLVKVEGKTTFSDVRQRLLNIRNARNQKSKFAYIVFMDSDSYREGLVSVYSLKRVTSNDVIAVVDPAVPLSFQMVLRQVATRTVVFEYGSPLWAYNLVDYEKVAIINPFELLIAPIDTRRVNLFAPDTPVTFLSNVAPKYVPESYEETTVVPLDQAKGFRDGLTIIIPNREKYEYAYTLDPSVSWIRRLLVTEVEYGSVSVSNISPLFVVNPLETDGDEGEGSVRGYYFRPTDDGRSILTTDAGYSTGVALWYRILNSILDTYSFLTKYYPQ